MAADYCHDILAAGGFRRIGTLDCDLHMELWWHAEHRLEVSVVAVADWALLRGTKYYRLKAMGEQGELYTRDLAAFDADLTTRFGEVHLLLSAFPDITPGLAHKRIAEKRFRQVSSGDEAGEENLPDRLDQLAAELETLQAAKTQDENLVRLDRGRSPTLERGMRERIGTTQGRIETILAERRRLSDRLAAEQHLEKEYLQKGAATCLLFGCCSNVQVAGCATEFDDVLRAVVKELRDVHQYQMQQKFQGGKLQIYIEEVDAPGVSLLTRWAGGVLCPRQLDRLGPEFESLRRAVEQQVMVFPNRDIVLGGAVQDEQKLVSARVVRNFLSAESEYAARYLGAGHELSSLKTGEALIQNADWGVVRVAVRPPLSKVWEPTGAEVRALVGGQGMKEPALSSSARAVLEAAIKDHRTTGQAVRLASIVERLGITSRRQIDQIVVELEAAEVAKFERLNERGRPFVLTPAACAPARTNRA